MGATTLKYPRELVAGDWLDLEGRAVRIASISWLDDEIGYHIELSDGTAISWRSDQLLARVD